MTIRPLAAATALIFSLSTIAQAGPTIVAAADASRASVSSNATWTDPPRRTSPVATTESPAVAPAPRSAAIDPAPVEPAPAVAEPPPAPVRAPAKPAGYRSASYKGGEGATWKTGRNAYGFSGSYGGCRYFGHAGRGGFSIDRVC